MDGEARKLILDYPCPWSYKVIGRDATLLRRAIGAVVRERPCRIDLSRQSRSGKYQSLLLELEVRDEADRTALYLALKAHADIVLVM